MGESERGGSESGEWGEGEGNKMAAKGEVAYRRFKKESVVLYVHVQASQLAIDYVGNQAR